MIPLLHESQYLVENTIVSSITGITQNCFITVRECYEFIQSNWMQTAGVLRNIFLLTAATLPGAAALSEKESSTPVT